MHQMRMNQNLQPVHHGTAMGPEASAPPPRMPSTQPPPPPSVQVMMAMQQKQNRIAPVTKPQGLDPVELLKEREHRYLWCSLLLCCIHCVPPIIAIRCFIALVYCSDRQ